MRAIVQYLQRRGYEDCSDDYYSRIKTWEEWYQGFVKSFHCYKQYNGKRKICRTRCALGMAKTVCEDWENLLLNEKVGISAGDEETTDRVWDILNDNRFRSRANRLVEMAFAMGTGAFVERLEDDVVKIDCIRAGLIYPLAWENGVITECAFASERKQGKSRIVYLNLHRLDGDEYVVENHMFRRDGENLTDLPLPEDVEEEVRTGSPVPRFQILTPNLVNNLDFDSPMGISVYANALDQLKACDLIYDSYCNEFRLGKKRILVPLPMARMQMEEDGTVTPVFDDNDTEFYCIPELDGDQNKITDFNMELRADAHEAGLQTALNTLSAKCGMGQDRYSFQRGEVKTATEIISEKSDLYQSMKKHELLLEAALVGLVRSICVLTGMDPEQDISVDFDDSIIEDSAAQREVDRRDVQDKLMAPYEYRMRWRGEDEETAKARVAEAAEGEPGLGFEV